MSDTFENNETDPSTQPVEQTPKAVSKRGRRLVIAIIIILLLALIGISVLLINLIAPRGGVAAADDTGGIEWVRSIYGWGPSPSQQLLQPQELFVTDNGTIWVTDSSIRTSAFAFNPDGSLETTAPASVEETVTGMGPIAQGIENRLFIGESMVDQIRVYDADFAPLGAFTFPNATDIDAREDRLLIGSTAGFAIANAENGEPIKIIGTRGKGPDEFDTVNGVTFGPGDRIYVVDTYNNRLNAYDTDGERIWSVATGSPANAVDLSGGGAMASSRETTAPAALQLPSDVCVDGNGRLVVVDAMDFSISVFDPEDGSFIAKYGEYGKADGQFVYPSSIAYDTTRDWFAVADSGNSRVQIVRIPGSGRAVDPAATIRRSLTGPLRACLVPLILLIIMVILFFVNRARKRRKAQMALQAGSVTAPVSSGTSTDDEDR